MLAAVAAGEALALTTAPDAAIGGVVARAISPVRRVEFALLVARRDAGARAR